MKKLLFALLLCSATFAQAHGPYGYRGGYYGGWVAPALIGGAIGYGLARPYYAPPPPVVYVQPPVYIQQQYQYPVVPEGYHYQQVIDPSCNCYKYALVPN